MTELTSSNRDIIDYLWDWAGSKGYWAKNLLKEVLDTSAPLSDAKRKNIYGMFRTEIGLSTGVTKKHVVKPTCNFTGDDIVLNTLSNVKGLNKLCSESKIKFSPNLTVIYGENGTGKSGYSRILKDMGFSYDNSNTLLPNIYNAGNPSISADIEYSCNNSPFKYCWTPSSQHEDLKNISVFNNDCVSIAIGKKRTLVVTPQGFHLFQLIKDELSELSKLLEEDKNALTLTYEWFENFHDDTEYQKCVKYIQSASPNTIESKDSFTESDQEFLDKMQDALKGFSVELLTKELKSLQEQHRELITIQSTISTQKKVLNNTNWNKLKKLLDSGKKLAEKGESSLSKMVSEKGVEVVSLPEFQAFIEAADKYLQKLPNAEYPESEEDICIFCNQPLKASESIDLIKKYRLILHDTTQQELQNVRKDFRDSLSTLKTELKELTIHQHTFGTDENGNALQPPVVTTFNSSIKETVKKLAGYDFSSSLEISFDDLEEVVSNKLVEIAKDIENKQNAISDIDGATAKLQTDINRLLDKKLFSDKKKELLEVVENYKIINKLNENVSDFNSRPLSNQTTKARQALIEQKFEEKFMSELKTLRKNNLQIDLSFGTQSGKNTISQTISRHNLTDILSEGEQKAISLSLFLTELDIIGGKAPVIFDDPVNSLDHKIVDEVTKRLLLLSKDRQVVIFTHSILFFNALLCQTNLQTFKPAKATFLNTENQYGECGIITDAKEQVNSAKSYVSKINQLLNNTPKGRAEQEVAAEGYGYLRSAIELTVEHEILNGAVKRYQKNIALTNFSKLSGEKIDKHKTVLNDIFEKCCGYITGHSNPTEVSSTPDLEQLSFDFRSYLAIRSEFN